MWLCAPPPGFEYVLRASYALFQVQLKTNALYQQLLDGTLLLEVCKAKTSNASRLQLYKKRSASSLARQTCMKDEQQSVILKLVWHSHHYVQAGSMIKPCEG